MARVSMAIDRRLDACGSSRVGLRAPGSRAPGSWWAVAGAILLSLLPASRSPAQSVVISELMARQGGGLRDEDGDESDWIELHGPGSEAVDLDGWYLTDDELDLQRWRFPPVVLAPGGYLLVFASGKDRSDADSELHTGFQLSADGEFLALVRPDGVTVEHAFAPSFPPQGEDGSWGLRTERLALVSDGSGVEVLIPGAGSSEETWRLPGFRPGPEWLAGGGAGVGFRVDGAVPPRALEAWWTFDATLDDATGRHDGAFRGGVPLHVEGPGDGLAGALRFDGVDDYVEVAPGGALPIYSEPAFSISLWVRGPPQADRRVFSEGSSRSSRPVFNIGVDNTGATGSVDIYIRDGAGETMVAHRHSAGVAFDGTWHHIAWVDDGGNAALYLDGERDAVDFSYERRPMDLDRTSIGAILRDGPSYFFGGDIGPVAVWTRLLSAEEVSALASGVAPSDLAGAGIDSRISVDLEEAMHGRSSSAWVRYPFSLDEPDAWDALRLALRLDDGGVVYLNGREVLGVRAPDGLGWDASAVASAPDDGVSPVVHDLSSHRDALRAGDNVLAIHGLNHGADDGDFLVHAELVATRVVRSDPRFFPTPSPGEPNGEGVPELILPPRFSHGHGFHDEAFFLALVSETEGVEIRFTLDGSAPGAGHGMLYTGPIAIETTRVVRAVAHREDLGVSGVATRTFIFPEHVLGQERPEGWPDRWAGHAADYAMDPRIAFAEEFRDRIAPAFESLPSLSLSIALDDLFGARGLYDHPQSSGSAWERPAAAELFPWAGRDGFAVACGVRIFGNRSRDPSASPKHGFRLVFRRQWGAPKLRHAVFPESPVDRFDTLVVRPNAFDSWVSNDAGQRHGATYLRDEWVRSAHRATGQVGVHGMPVHLWLNGLYWGVYNLTERPDASFGAEHLGGDKEEWDSIKTHEEVVDGTIDAYRHLDSLRAAGITGVAARERIRPYLCFENLADYMILNMFAPSTDWPGNYYMIRRRDSDVGFRFFCWDSEYAFLGGVTNNRTVEHWRDDDSPTKFHHAMRADPEYRVLFGDRVHRLLGPRGILEPEAVERRWSDLMDTIGEALICESARWGDHRRSTPYRPDVEWEAECRELIEGYFPRRTDIVLGQFRAQGLYPNVEAPALSRGGGLVPPGASVTLSAPRGRILCTRDGTDPRREGGAVSPSAVEIVSGGALAPVLQTTHVVARVLDGARWSSRVDATYVTDAPSPLRVVEIMYHPSDPGPEDERGDGTFEYVEILNTADEPVGLTGLRFVGGIEFDFSDSEVRSLPPGGLVLVVKDQDAFVDRYGGEAAGVVAGEYGGQLANGGEELLLVDAADRVVAQLVFDDRWVPSTDGTGPSLVAVDPLAPPAVWSHPSQWTESAAALGTPGELDVPVDAGGLQRPGDATQDGRFDISDPILLLGYLFQGAPRPPPCGAASITDRPASDLLDVNGDGGVDLSDAVHSLLYLFQGGEPPALGAGCVRIPGCADVCTGE